MSVSVIRFSRSLVSLLYVVGFDRMPLLFERRYWGFVAKEGEDKEELFVVVDVVASELRDC